MSIPIYAKGIEARVRELERRGKQDRTDIQRLWKRIPQSPQSYVGTPWGGPSSEEFIPGESGTVGSLVESGGTGGTPLSGTGPGSVTTGTPTPSGSASLIDCFSNFSCSLCTSGAPFAWVLSVSGISDASCSPPGCSVYNGSHILAYNTGCSWKKVTGAAICGFPGVSSIDLGNSGLSWDIRFVRGTSSLAARYDLVGTFDCRGPNTFTKSFTTADCAGWPATITIYPAAADGTLCEVSGVSGSPLSGSATAAGGSISDEVSGSEPAFTCPGELAGSAAGGDWVNPSNVTAEDGNVAWTGFPSGVAAAITASNFGFSIPSTAVITGIQVRVGKFAQYDEDANNIIDNVQLIKTVDVVGSLKAAGRWPTSQVAYVYGGETDLWGTTWTPAEINASTFGLRLQAQRAGGPSNTAYIDYIEIGVCYTDDLSGGTADTGGTVVTGGTVTGGTINTGGSVTGVDCTGATLCDRFTDTDTTALSSHTMNVGSGWTEHSGSWSIQSNKAELSSADATGNATADAATADVSIICDGTIGNMALTSNAAPGVVFRWSDDSNYWACLLNKNNGRIEIYRIQGGGSNLEATATVSISFLENFGITASASGTTISCTFKGTTATKTAATFNQTQTRHGLRSVQSITADILTVNKFDYWRVD